jgi:hypothetical protein
MSKLRPIAAVKLPGVKVQLPAGARPELFWIPPTGLLVDEAYQRGLSKESYRLIRKLAAGFAWNRMKPPIVVKTESGWHVIDGQHTAIAAASIGLKEIPVLMVEAGTAQIRAAAFVGHNTDRMRVSPIAVYRAMVAAEDPDALDVANVCRRAGVRICAFNNASVVAEGDTMAIGTIRALIKKRGVRKSRFVLEALRKGRLAPISAHEIAAADRLMHGLPPGCDMDVLAAIVRADPDGFHLARVSAVKQKRLVCDVLAERWAAALAKVKV